MTAQPDRNDPAHQALTCEDCDRMVGVDGHPKIAWCRSCWEKHDKANEALTGAVLNGDDCDHGSPSAVYCPSCARDHAPADVGQARTARWQSEAVTDDAPTWSRL